MHRLKESSIGKALVLSVKSVLEDMAFLTAESVQGNRITAEPAFFIHLQNPVKGALILSVSEEDKIKIAENVYGKAGSEINVKESNECLLEFVNVVTGQFVNRLDVENTQYALGIPKLISREGDLYSYSYGYDFFFEAEGIMLQIRLLFNKPLVNRRESRKRIFLEREILHKARELDDMKDATIFALANLVEYRDPETASHLERIREYSRILAKELSTRDKYDGIIDIDFIHNIYVMSVLHDIGKVGIPDSILLKEGKLTKEEFACMKTHTVIGASSLDAVCTKNKAASYLAMARDIARHHHEKWDGTGYPDGLAGENIPLAARITTLADVFDALSTKRVYKKAFPMERVECILETEAGKTFDPEVYDAYVKTKADFIKVKDKYSDAAYQASAASERTA